MNDLEKMTTDKRGGFTWGKLVEIHHIGDYDIVEFHPRVSGRTGTYEAKALFHPFACGGDICESHLSLDVALIAAITHKATGGTMGAPWIVKMLGIEAGD